MTTFTKDNAGQAGVFSPFQKKTVTLATRIEGPFAVKTREGEISCPDGWLAIDAHGWPYPIAADEFAVIYEAVA